MKLILTEKKEEVPGVESFIFKPEEPFYWKAGQFLHYVLHHEPTDERGSDRWFTVSSAPSEEHVRITTRLAPEKGSSFKQALQELKAGDTIEVSDIDGEYVVDSLDREYVFIVGGIGITPVRSILKELDAAGGRISATLLYANRDQNIVFKDELESFAKENPKLRIHYVLSPERIDEAKIRETVPELARPFFYVSGPEPMVESMGALLKELGVPSDHLRQDWFPGYPAE